MEIDDFQATTEAFLSWLSEVGVRINAKMVLKDLRSEGRGRGVSLRSYFVLPDPSFDSNVFLVAAAGFEEDELVFSIPRGAVLNVGNVLSSTGSTNWRESLQNMPSWLSLTAAMISEGQRSNSQWAPYLAVLPKKLDSLVFWSEEELAELQACSVLQKIGRAGAEEMFGKHLVPLGIANSNYEFYHRVASVIMAYAFDIPEEDNTKHIPGPLDDDNDDLVSDDGKDEKTILSMIPLADMLNADAERNNARLCCDNEELEMRTIKPIAAGEEIFNDYGQLPRSDLLRRYGYITENYAIYDVAEISASSIISVAGKKLFTQAGETLVEGLTANEIEKRVALAEREGCFEESYDLVHSRPEEPAVPVELLAFVYILLVDDETLEAILNSKASIPRRSKLCSQLVGKFLSAVIWSKIMDYTTTWEEDCGILKDIRNDEPCSTRKLMAVQVRKGEKAVLKKSGQEAEAFDGSNARMRVAKKKSLARESQKMPPVQQRAVTDDSIPSGKGNGFSGRVL
ncbi:putative ribosomal N-lysine methyltransferase 4 [Amylocarpus encephaloides]|uniref:Ribosomal N-lysine methyltransferase 4 n=1 Tax=Amylocarpus encephaloides TaxID=45428 RepID=A0A9P7YF08_9HELO|nr:putative ribosomal N-lysine methyltransferase 4 [Amylocarpus encephaloides]